MDKVCLLRISVGLTAARVGADVGGVSGNDRDIIYRDLFDRLTRKRTFAVGIVQEVFDTFHHDGRGNSGAGILDAVNFQNARRGAVVKTVEQHARYGSLSAAYIVVDRRSHVRAAHADIRRRFVFGRPEIRHAVLLIIVPGGVLIIRCQIHNNHFIRAAACRCRHRRALNDLIDRLEFIIGGFRIGRLVLFS